MADTLVNFELPWNPAKKNQRIGRIDRLGQKNNKLTIFNLISRDSIEQQIAAGLLVKQSLFDGVLGDNANTNFVDFSSKGHSQFIAQLEEFIATQETLPDAGFKENEEVVAETVISTEEETVEYNISLPDELTVGKDANEMLAEEAGKPETRPLTPQPEEIEQVMNNGLLFLAGLFKMSTGKDIGMEGQAIEVNRETGEVIMKFNLPGFGGR